MAGGRGRRSFAAMTTHIAPSPVPVRLRAAQGLLGLLGAVVTFASIYFSVVAPPEPVNGPDWLVAAWALAIGVTALSLAPRLTQARARRAALALLACHALFGVVKLVAYDESAAFPFIALDALIALLLAAPRLRGFRS
jgi:hypothetical protein